MIRNSNVTSEQQEKSYKSHYFVHCADNFFPFCIHLFTDSSLHNFIFLLVFFCSVALALFLFDDEEDWMKSSNGNFVQKSQTFVLVFWMKNFCFHKKKRKKLKQKCELLLLCFALAAVYVCVIVLNMISLGYFWPEWIKLNLALYNKTKRNTTLQKQMAFDSVLFFSVFLFDYILRFVWCVAPGTQRKQMKLSVTHFENVHEEKNIRKVCDEYLFC